MRETRLQITSSDGVENCLVILEPPDPNGHAVLCVPAMGIPARKYQALAETLVAKGLAAAYFDLRGNGESSVRASKDVDFSYTELVETDFPVAMAALVSALPNRKILLLGHSLGGQVATLYLARQKEHEVAGLILCASCTVYYRGWPWPASWNILFITQLFALIAKLIGYLPGKKLGFGGREARSVMRDWAYNARTGDYRLYDSSVDYTARMATLKLPVLAINFSDDNFAPRTATKHLLNKLNKDAEVTKVQLSASDLGITKADHIGWIKHPQAVGTAIHQWCKTHL